MRKTIEMSPKARSGLDLSKKYRFTVILALAPDPTFCLVIIGQMGMDVARFQSCTYRNEEKATIDVQAASSMRRDERGNRSGLVIQANVFLLRHQIHSMGPLRSLDLADCRVIPGAGELLVITVDKTSRLADMEFSNRQRSLRSGLEGLRKAFGLELASSREE